MKNHLISFLVIVNFTTATFATEVVNVVNFLVRNSFHDEFTTASGHKLELVNGDQFTVDKEIAKKVSLLIGEELLNLEKNRLGKEKADLREIIFGYRRYLLQMQGYKIGAGNRKVYVAATPLDGKNCMLDENDKVNLPKTLILPDGGGMFHWQAYVDMEKPEVIIVFNQEY